MKEIAVKPGALDRSRFDRLSEASGRDLISSFVKTHRSGRDVDQDRIRVKNATSEAEAVLTERGWKPRERSDRLSPVRDLDNDREFWEHQSAGLAIYVDEEGHFEAVALDHKPETGVFVMPVYSLRSLVDNLGRSSHAVLALTMGDVALFEFGVSGMEQVDASLPESMDDLNWFVDREPQRQQHPGGSARAADRHGHDPKLGQDEDRDRFLRAVDSQLSRAVEADRVIVLGDDDLVARFSALSDLDTMSPENSGLSSPLSTVSVRDAAAPVVEQIEEETTRSVVADAIDQIGLGNATTELSDALPDAVSGRLGRLVISRQQGPIWGRMDSQSLEMIVRDEPTPADVDLIDRLVVEAVRTGADVFAVDGSVDGEDFVAVRRF